MLEGGKCDEFELHGAEGVNKAGGYLLVKNAKESATFFRIPTLQFILSTSHTLGPSSRVVLPILLGRHPLPVPHGSDPLLAASQRAARVLRPAVVKKAPSPGSYPQGGRQHTPPATRLAQLARIGPGEGKRKGLSQNYPHSNTSDGLGIPGKKVRLFSIVFGQLPGRWNSGITVVLAYDVSRRVSWATWAMAAAAT